MRVIGRPAAPDRAARPWDSGGSSFLLFGLRASIGVATIGPNGTMNQSGGANESFSYTKDYSINGSGNWQCLPLPHRGRGGGVGERATAAAVLAAATPSRPTPARSPTRRPCRRSPPARSGKFDPFRRERATQRQQPHLL